MRRVFLAAVVLSLAPFAARADTGFTVPPPSLLERLQRHRDRDWLRVTTDGMRYEVRVARIDVEGIAGLTPRHGTPAPPPMVPWSRIARIDQRLSHALRGRITGLVVGAGAGAALGAIESSPEAGHAPTGFWLGAAAGTWLGGVLGDHIVHERALYVAESPADTVPVVLAPPPSRESTFVAMLSASRDITRACRILRPGDLLRMEGTFGSFQGYAAHANLQGLDGLRSDIRARAAPAPQGVVRWDQIYRLERHGTRFGEGALHSGLAFGATGALLTTLIGLAFDVDPVEIMGPALLVGVATGGVGALLGGAVGASIPGWHVVYDAR